MTDNEPNDDREIDERIIERASPEIFETADDGSDAAADEMAYEKPLFQRDPPETIRQSDVITAITCGADGYGVAVWDHAEGPTFIEYDNLGQITDTVTFPSNGEAIDTAFEIANQLVAGQSGDGIL